MSITNAYYYTSLNTPIDTVTHNLGFTTTTGRTLVAVYAACTSGQGTSDDSATSFTVAGATFSKKVNRTNAVVGLQIWVAENITGGATQVTGFTNISGGNQYFYLYEVSAAASSYDSAGSNKYLSSTTNPKTAGAITTAQAGELVFSAFLDGWNNLHTISSVSSGFTIDHQDTQGVSGSNKEQSVFCVATRTLTSATTITPDVTLDSASASSATNGSVSIKLEFPPAATTPSPADDAVDVSSTPTFTWDGDSQATSFNIYLGTTSGALSLDGTSVSESYSPGQLTYGETYYWRVDTVWAGGEVTGTEWSFTVDDDAPLATNPSPADDETDVVINPTLTWDVPGYFDDWDIYLGPSVEDLELVEAGSTSTSYSPSELAYGRFYYWRIDGNYSGGVVTGTVWSFRVDRGPVTDPDYFTTVDVLLHVVNSSTAGTNIGLDSQYSTSPHKGTLKKIEGFRWDEMRWPSKDELEGYEYADAMYDSETNFIPVSYYKSGIGDNSDLLLTKAVPRIIDGTRYILPEVMHGYFYLNDEERYLFSDDVITQYAHIDIVESGVQYVDLDKRPKPGNPIHAYRYRFDKTTGKYNIDLNVRKVTEFTTTIEDGEYLPAFDDNGNIISGNLDLSQEEFIVDNDFSPARIWFNQNFSENIGGEIDVVGEVTDEDQIQELELLGIADGVQSIFPTRYSPVDRSGELQVWSYLNPALAVEWTEIDLLSGFSSSYEKEFKVDYDLGRIIFDTEGNAQLPGGGNKIAIRYTAGLALKYEPEYSRDITSLTSSDVSPLNTGVSRGFVQVTSGARNAATVVLAADMDVSDDDSDLYQVDVGNSLSKVYATVRDSNGIPVDGLIVNFEIVSPQYGVFANGSTEAAALTNDEGIATVFYSPPSSVRGFGYSSDSIEYSGNATWVHFYGGEAPSDLEQMFLYEVLAEDEVLGIAQGDLAEQYTDFFSAEEIEGGTATQTYEETHRGVHSLLTSATYTSSDEDLSVGAKRIVLTTLASGAIDTHTGFDSASAPVPLFPLDYQLVDDTIDDLMLLYTGHLTVPGENGVKAYQVISNTRTSLRASVLNPNTGRTIQSNVLEVELVIPESSNGLFIAQSIDEISSQLLSRVRDIDDVSAGEISGTEDALSDVYEEEKYFDTSSQTFETFEEWFRRTRRGDSKLLGLGDELFSGTFPNKIALGFRLKGRNATLASLVDQVVFYDPNDPLAGDYFSGIV